MNERLRKFLDLIYTDVRERRLRTALTRIRAFAKEQQLPEIASEAEAIERRYFYMLRSMAMGMPDPNQHIEIAGMLESTLVLGLRAFREASIAKGGDTLYDSYARYASIRGEENISTLAVDFLTEHAALMSDPAALTDSSKRAPLERLSRDIFHRAWVEYPLDLDSADALYNLVEAEDVPMADREAWINAVVLGLLYGYDPERIALLLRFTRLDDTRLRAASLSGIFLALYRWWFAEGGPTMWTTLRKLERDPDYSEDMRTVIYEFARQLHATGLATNIERDVLPGINSLGADLMQKLSGIDLSQKSPEELRELLSGASLPGLDNDKVRSSMRNINEMAEAGDDVFFAFLKPMHQQSFFNDIANWWMPFDTSRSEFAEIFEGEGAVLGEMFDKLEFLCDSDKYAVLMAVAAAPRSMRARTLSMMIEQYGMIAEQMGEKTENYDARFRHSVANYMKNAFRFYTLFRRKGELYNPFTPEIGFNSLKSIAGLYTSAEAVLSIADRLSDSGLRPFAFPFYMGLIESGAEVSASTYMRAAQSAESTRRFDLARDWYHEAYELDPTKEEALRGNVSMLRNLGDLEGALEILDEAGVDKIENVKLLRKYADALFEVRRFDDAQTVIDKIIYTGTEEDATGARLLQASILIEDGNALGAIEAAEQLLAGPLSAEREQAAWRHSGMGYLACRQPDKAYAALRRSMGPNPNLTTVEICSDYLRQKTSLLTTVYGIAPEDINAMCDALRYTISATDIPFVN
ncbi:MAG: hypothetical protein K2M06_03120 [Muribaculaceae bacterium]|nr:hypothetical protein [Muribaculaceae bacterium]